MPDTQVTSPFRSRLWFAACVGPVVKMNGKWVSLPLEHRRPKEPFDPLLRLWRYARPGAHEVRAIRHQNRLLSRRKEFRGADDMVEF